MRHPHRLSAGQSVWLRFQIRLTSSVLQFSLQRITLTCGREERFSMAVWLLPRASIVHDNK